MALSLGPEGNIPKRQCGLSDSSLKGTVVSREEQANEILRVREESLYRDLRAGRLLDNRRGSCGRRALSFVC